MATQAPTAKHTSTVIMLHGRDSDASTFAEEFFESQATDLRTLPQIFPGIKWVFPSAKMIQSARFDCMMSQWFDMYTTENPHERDEEQNLSDSMSRIQSLLKEEAAIIGSEHVILGGISQGAAVAIRVLLEQDMKLGGMIGLCTWLPRIERASTTAAALQTPVFLGHSEDDEVIGIKYGEELRDKLKESGMDVTWESYQDGGHWINEPKGVTDIVRFLTKILD